MTTDGDEDDTTRTSASTDPATTGGTGNDDEVDADESAVSRHVRRWGQRLAYAGLATFLFLLSLLLILYALSFAAPPPVEERPVDYSGDPGTVLANATYNQWTDTYQVRLEGTERLPDGTTRQTVERRLTINNQAGIYTTRLRRGVLLRNRSYRPARAYGTLGGGYTRRPPDVGTLIDRGTGSWERDDAHRYHPNRNVLTGPKRVETTDVDVVSTNESAYVARVENRTVAAEVGYPLRLDTDGNWTASLTVTVDRQGDRIERAVFRYENRTSGREVRAVHEIRPDASPHRPTATYPPSAMEILARIDRGFATLDALSPLSTAGTWGLDAAGSPSGGGLP